MLNVVDRYAQEYDIKINALKTVYMIFNENIKRKKSTELADSMISLSLDEVFLTKVTEFKYLGVYIKNTQKNTNHLNEMKKKIHSQYIWS